MKYIITDEQLEGLVSITGTYVSNEIKRRLTVTPYFELATGAPAAQIANAVDTRQHTHRTVQISEQALGWNTINNEYRAARERVEQRSAEPVTNTSLEAIETLIKYAYPRAIKLERMFNNRPQGETLTDFLEKFFTVWNVNRDTIYADDGSRQTECGKRRSLGDIYMICKYYYPRTTLKEVADILYNELPEIITEGYRSSWCTQILKRVWYYKADEPTECLNKTRNDEYGVPQRWWIEQLSRTAVTA